MAAASFNLLPTISPVEDFILFSSSNGTTLPVNSYSHLSMSCDEYFKNLTKEALEAVLGPQKVSKMYQVMVGIIYPIIFVTGVLGNVCTCIVIVKTRYLHNSTNFYLLNLAISDLLVLVSGLPYELYQALNDQYPWRLGNFFCHSRALICELSPVVSVLTIVAFTVERYVAICHPLRSHALSNFHRCVCLIALCWIIATIYATPMGVITEPILTLPYNETLGLAIKAKNAKMDHKCPVPDRYNTDEMIPASLHCGPPFPSRLTKSLFQISAFLFFALPLTVIFILYARIGAVLCSSSLAQHTSRYEKPRKAVIRMLAAVVFAFFICWAPFHFQRLFSVYWPAQDTHALKTIIYYLSGCLYFVSSTINPVLYNLMSIKFRRAFLLTFCRWPTCHRRHPQRASVPVPNQAQHFFPLNQYTNNYHNNFQCVNKHNMLPPLLPGDINSCCHSDKLVVHNNNNINSKSNHSKSKSKSSLSLFARLGLSSGSRKRGIPVPVPPFYGVSMHTSQHEWDLVHGDIICLTPGTPHNPSLSGGSGSLSVAVGTRIRFSPPGSGVVSNVSGSRSAAMRAVELLGCSGDPGSSSSSHRHQYHQHQRQIDKLSSSSGCEACLEMAELYRNGQNSRSAGNYSNSLNSLSNGANI